MKLLPVTNATLLVRTDFSDDAAWNAVCDEIRHPAPGYLEGLEEWTAFHAAIGQWSAPQKLIHLL